MIDYSSRNNNENDQITKDVVGVTCSINGTDKKYIHFTEEVGGGGSPLDYYSGLTILRFFTIFLSRSRQMPG
jgi:hypothetical protein